MQQYKTLYLSGHDMSESDWLMNRWRKTEEYLEWQLNSSVAADLRVAKAAKTTLEVIGFIEMGTAVYSEYKASSLVDNADDAARFFDELSKWADDYNSVISRKGYRPKSGERTLEGFLKKYVSSNKELGLYTDSPGFNNNPKGIGGQFKRFGVKSHGGLSPHVHQPIRNVAPNGNIYGVTGTKTHNGGVTSPSPKDIKQLYQYIFNDKYISQ